MMTPAEAFKARVAQAIVERKARPVRVCRECGDCLWTTDVAASICSLCAADAALITLRKVGA